MIDVQRSQPPPEILDELARKRDQKLHQGDLPARLFADFLGKCYLCERPIMGSGDIEIDHRVPLAAGGPRYAWDNLCCADPSCNKRRPDWPEGGLLDPAGPDGVERHLIQGYQFNEGGRLRGVFRAVDAENTAAVNTARELDHIHNDDQPKAWVIRDSIEQRLAQVSAVALRYKKARKQAPESASLMALLEKTLRAMAARTAPYTMMVRSHLRRLVPELDVD